MEQNLTMLNFVVSLNFDNPLGFITSLQTEVDNQMYLKRLPIACSLSLKTASNKEDVGYDSNWKLGQHEYLIYCNNHKKIIARLYSFKIADKQCFWYYIPKNNKTKVSDLSLITFAIKEAFVNDNFDSQETSIIEANEPIKIKTFASSIDINAGFVYFPLLAGYVVIMICNPGYFLPLLVFLLPVTFVVTVTYFIE